MSTQPRYVIQAGIAQHLNVHHTTLIKWLRNYPADHQQVPTPAPAAFILSKHGTELPMWHPEQLAEWDAWHDAYLAYSQVNRRARLGQARAARAV
jgi:hypothetical protein